MNQFNFFLSNSLISALENTNNRLNFNVLFLNENKSQSSTILSGNKNANARINHEPDEPYSKFEDRSPAVLKLSILFLYFEVRFGLDWFREARSHIEISVIQV